MPRVLPTAVLACVGGVATYLFALPDLWRMSLPYAVAFAVVAAAQLAATVLLVVRRSRRRVLVLGGLAGFVVVWWAVSHAAGVGPDPWLALDRTIGFTDTVCAALQLVAAVLSGVVASEMTPRAKYLADLYHGPRPRVARTLAIVPLTLVVLLLTTIGAVASSNGFAGTDAVRRPADLPAGRRSTVEYCRPDGVPLLMDLYPPGGAGPHPVALYVHGGGFVLGNRGTMGAGNTLANHSGALFKPLRERLNQLGFLVASIDYRLGSGTPWPAQLTDAKCAVRFLRAHAGELGADAGRIGVWGSSAGGQLASLLGVTGREIRFDVGPYRDQSSAVQAVVDMFGPADVEHLADSPAFARFCAYITLRGAGARRAASPLTYDPSGAPPFLILHGTDDTTMPIRHSDTLADRLHLAGVETQLLRVKGTAHTLDTPGEQPSADELTERVATFFASHLSG